MTALAATLTEFSDNGNSRTYTSAGHSAVKPKLVIQKRVVPTGNQLFSEFSVTVIQAVEDPEGGVMPQKVSMGVTVRYPTIGSDPTDLGTVRDAALALLQDIVQSDEFIASVVSQGWVE